MIKRVKVAKLRFKADDGSEFPEWEEKKIGDFLNESRIPGHTGKQAKKLTVKLWAKGIVPKESYLQGSEGTQYYVRHAGQLMYGKLDFLNCAFGIVPEELDGYESTIDSPAFDIHGILSDYLLAYITRKEFYKRNGDLANGTRKAKRIQPDVFFDMDINVPSLPEQKKIADFLSTIDEIITTTEAELTAWQERKKGVMQKIFNREVRFKADDGSEFPEWEEKKFGDIWKRIVVKNDGSFGGDKIISVANMKWAPKDDVRDDYLKTYNLLPSSAIAFEGNRNNSYSYGRFVLNDIGDGIVSHVFVCFEPIADIIPAFWKEYIHAECVMGKILRKCTKSSTMMHDLVVPDFLKQIIFVPSLPEQKKIADCLSSLDDVINQIKAELSAWKEFKKGLLQQMFV